MAVQTSQLIVELLDRVSAPARRVAGSLNGITRVIREQGNIPLTVTDRLNAAMQRTNERLASARMGVIDAVGAYYTLRTALGAPIQAAANFETALEDIGQKAGIPTEKLAELGERIKQIAIDTNTSASQIAEAVDALVGRGVDVNAALIAASPIGKAATAYRAATEDLAAAAQAAVDNLKVPAADIERTLDMMAQAGKEGAFELRDMARYFPSLGAAYQGLGQSGTAAVADLAAALQIVRKGTGDSESAATNLANVLQKVYAPATVKKFADQGVDIFKEMEAAAKRGLTPIEAIAEITDKTLKGDLSKLGFLFEDAQVQAGMRALIQNMDEYREIRAKALAANGVVMADYERRIRTAAGAQARWAATVERLNLVLGTTLLPLLNDLLDGLIPIIDAVGQLATDYPGLTRAVVSATAAFIAFRGATAALSFIGLTGKAGALSMMAGAMNTIGRAGGGLGAAAREALRYSDALAAMAGADKLTGLSRMGVALRGMLMAVPGVSLIGSALTAVGAALATVTAPVWAAIAVAVAAVAAAGYTLWKYWDRAKAVLSGVGRALGEILSPAIEKVRPLLDWLAPLGDLIAAGWEKARAAVAAVGEWLSSFFQREVLTDEQKAGYEQAGYDAIMALWDGMKKVMADLLAWVQAKVEALLSPFSGMSDRIASYFNMGGAEGVTSDPMGTGIDGARAKGGPISRGGRYLVGENGPEIITASRNGYVHPTGSGSGSAPTIHVGGIVVNAAPGMDEEALAAKVARRIESMAQSAFRGVQADTGVEAY